MFDGCYREPPHPAPDRRGGSRLWYGVILGSMIAGVVLILVVVLALVFAVLRGIIESADPPGPAAQVATTQFVPLKV